MDELPRWVWLALGAGINFAAAWGGVRVSLRFLHEGVKEAKAIGARAHERIDHLLERS